MVRRITQVVFSILLLGGCAELVTDILEYGSVVVETRRRSGDPVAGVRLTLYTGTRVMAIGQTGADGRFLFENLPPDVRGGYGVYAEPPEGYARPEEILGGASVATFHDGLGLEEGEQKTATFTYVKIGPGAISVTVRGLDGTPVPGILVTLYRPTGPEGKGVSGADGGVRFDPVPFGNWGVALLDLPAGFLDWDEGAPFLDGIPIEEGSEEAVAFTLEPCQGTLAARVVDPNGAPVAGYPVQLYNASVVLEEGVTGADGVRSFGPLGCLEFGMKLGRLLPWLFDEGPQKDFFDGIRVTRGSLQTFRFEVVRCAGMVRIRVEDLGGVPVPGAGLTLYTSQGEVARGMTDATGAFGFPDAVCGVQYGVSVQPPSGFTVTEGRGSSFFDGIMLEDGEQTSLTFRLAAG